MSNILWFFVHFRKIYKINKSISLLRRIYSFRHIKNETKPNEKMHLLRFLSQICYFFTGWISQCKMFIYCSSVYYLPNMTLSNPCQNHTINNHLPIFYGIVEFSIVSFFFLLWYFSITRSGRNCFIFVIYHWVSVYRCRSINKQKIKTPFL